MNLAEFSQKLTDNLTADLNYEEEKKEIVAYGIETFFLTALGFLIILGISYVLNSVFPAIIATIFGGSLRKLSGGAHFSTPTKCLLFGAVVYSLIGVSAKEIVAHGFTSPGVLLAVLVVSLVIVFIYAPVDSEAKPIHSHTFRKKLKVASLAFVLLTLVIVLLNNNLLINTSAVMGIGYQSLTLLPVFNKRRKEA